MGRTFVAGTLMLVFAYCATAQNVHRAPQGVCFPNPPIKFVELPRFKDWAQSEKMAMVAANNPTSIEIRGKLWKSMTGSLMDRDRIIQVGLCTLEELRRRDREAPYIGSGFADLTHVILFGSAEQIRAQNHLNSIVISRNGQQIEIRISDYVDKLPPTPTN